MDAMGLAVGDYDDDTDPDLFITHWMAQENGLFWNTIRSFDQGDVKGALQFMDIADMLGLGRDAVRIIPVDDDLRLRVDVLREAMAGYPPEYAPARRHLRDLPPALREASSRASADRPVSPAIARTSPSRTRSPTVGP